MRSIVSGGSGDVFRGRDRDGKTFTVTAPYGKPRSRK
jgi:hypothetical protein